MLDYFIALSFIHLSYSYSPSSEVRTCHSIPHLNGQLQKQSPTFQSDFDLSTTSGYFASLITLPAIILAVGLFSILLFLLIVWSRCCFTCSKCSPMSLEDARQKTIEDFQAWVRSVNYHRRKILCFFVVFLLAYVFATNTIYFGNRELTRGVRKVADSISDLTYIIDNLITTSYQLKSDSVSLQSVIKNGNCLSTASNTLIGYLDDTITAVESVNSTLSDIPNKLNDKRSSFLHFGIFVRELVVYIFYAILMALAILYAFAACLRIFCCILMVGVMLMADVCMAPTQNLVDLLPSGNIQDTLSYYSTCTGSNPIGFDVTNATASVALVKEYYVNLTTSGLCQNSSYLSSNYYIVQDLSYQVSNLTSFAECSPIQNIWDKAINIGLCDNTFTGIYVIWLAIFVTSGALYFTMCFASVLYEYFNDFWNISENDHHALPVLAPVIDEMSPNDTTEGGGDKPTAPYMHYSQELV
eukprot:gene7292-9934_t